MTTLAELNAADQAQFAAVCGPLFEHSPWIAERTWPRRPFATRTALHRDLCATVERAALDEQLALIRAHPDLVGRAALAGQLTAASSQEQAAAGLDALSADEIRRFQEYNAAYRERFGFPFVICAREHKKDAILAALPMRLNNSPQQEINTALAEIGKIVWLRLLDAVAEEA
ncbi:MAG TPA: 2-oxo-4-hydroxy-4-carboxy-5-ureidoimidazoline decarboxylase [Pirellulales bacterium]|nr:2-oxo-4-hydroxy-4-carboxy-5-ureidoimidazoline decarboxylase [Pirellulales bacterium]